MPEPFETATLRVVLRSETHAMPDVAFLVEALENLVIASVWGVTLDPEPSSEAIVRARSLIQKRADYKASKRFHPRFRAHAVENLPQFRVPISDWEVRPEGRRSEEDSWDVEEPDFDPFDPLDAGLQTGMNSWFRRVIHQEDRRLYNELFSFARVTRLEHHSPLAIELTVALAAAVILPPVLVLGCMRAIYFARFQEEKLRQERARSKIMDRMAEAIKEARFPTEMKIPDQVLVETSRIATPAVDDLAKSPLIGEITIGQSVKTGD